MKFYLAGFVILIAFLTASTGWAESSRSGRATISMTTLYVDEQSLVYNNEGIVPKEGLNFYLRGEFSGKIAPFELLLEPLVSENHNTIHKGYLRLATPYFNFDIGKESLWWGQGVHGGLFLTHNAEPLPMLRLFNHDLRHFQFDIFFSQLEEAQFIPKPYFQGTRIVFKPHSILQVGMTRTIIMGGEGRPGINPSRFISIWFGENREPEDELSNSIAGLDFRITFPSAQFYGEVGGEDEAGGYPSKDAFLLGIYLPKNDFRIEYADISNPAWYVHGTYQSGYTYKGRILGHHVGGGGRDIFLEKGVIKTDRVQGKIALDYEERGITTQPVTERHYQAGTSWKFIAGKMMFPWTADIDFAYDLVRNNTLFKFSLVGQI